MAAPDKWLGLGLGLRQGIWLVLLFVFGSVRVRISGVGMVSGVSRFLGWGHGYV